MGSLLSKTTPSGGQESQPTPGQQTKDEKENKDVTSSDPTEAVTSATGDTTGQGDTGSTDTTEAASSTKADVVNKTDADKLPEPREDTTPETHVTESPDVATKVADERGDTKESPGVTTDVSHDSPTQIPESPAAAASHVEHSAECTSSDAGKLTNPEPESNNSSSTAAETTELNSSTNDTHDNEDNRPEHQHQATEHDNSVQGPGEQHSTTDIEQQLEEMNLAPNDSLQEM